LNAAEAKKEEDFCRVLFINAPGDPGWRECLWGADLGPMPGKPRGRRVSLRNSPVGTMLEPPDPKCPGWGDVILAIGDHHGNGLKYDLVNGVILERHPELRVKKTKGP
jgi:hypothetical protein